jgi:hypothetical protein
VKLFFCVEKNIAFYNNGIHPCETSWVHRSVKMQVENNNRTSRRLEIPLWKTAREQQGVTWQHSTVVNNVATTTVPLLDLLPCESLGGFPYTLRVPQLAIKIYLMFYLIISFLVRRSFCKTIQNKPRNKKHFVTLKTGHFAGMARTSKPSAGGRKTRPSVDSEDEPY